MNKHTTYRFYPLISLVILMCSCHHDEEFKIERCLPSYLHSNTDSIVFQYDAQRKPVASLYFFSSQYLTGSNEFEYNNEGELVTLRNYNHKIFTNDVTLNSTYTLDYNDSGQPSVLHCSRQNLPNTEIQTQFIHDDQGRLTDASIFLISKNSSFESAGYRYEYDDKDNVVKIFYKVRLNNSPAFTEVLARENLRFDDSQVFYKNSKALNIANVYMFNYVPNVNNCLSAKVYYPDFKSHFVRPEEFEFTSSYNEDGLITQLADPSFRAQLYLDDVLFTRISYDCK